MIPIQIDDQPEKLHAFGFKIVTPIEFLQELET